MYSFKGAASGGTSDGVPVGGYDVSTNVNSAAQSIDTVIATFVRSSPILPMRAGTLSDTSTKYNKCEADSSLYFDRLGQGVSRYQFQINNAPSPSYQAIRSPCARRARYMHRHHHTLGTPAKAAA